MPSVLPPFLSTGDPGSFAMRTIVERKPRIVAQVLESNRAVPSDVREGFEELVRDIREGVVASPIDGRDELCASFEPEELLAWESEMACYAGRRWLDLPWFFAEAYFYLRLLVAWGYYDSSSPRGIGAGNHRLPLDPFQALKEQELCGPQGGLAVARQIARAVEEAAAESDALALLLRSSLWGNRVDLGCFELDESRRREVLSRGEESLVVDHTERVLGELASARRVGMIIDNAGSELACDLLLADRLLSEARRAATLHVKRSPFFVSDAMVKDVVRTIAAFSSDADPLLARSGRRLEEAIASGRLVVRDSWFWSSPLHFTRMPPLLRAGLAADDIVIVKGDANYRRLLEDRRWEPWRTMEEIAGYFPAPFACLRTMKSEIVVDVPCEKAESLWAADPEWLTNGRRGLVRYCRPGGRGAGGSG
ncbi:MAG: damage-control phosphatase ARMT1 family protein [Spirochaetes bacterium]|nr:damage-control phosphatase ARMT1 family protein [Spirochaetota bacterium]